MEEKVTMWLNNSFSACWLMVRLNLSSDDVKTINKQLCSLKKEILNLENKDFYLKNSNSATSLQQVRLVKVLENYPKPSILNSFNDVEIC